MLGAQSTWHVGNGWKRTVSWAGAISIHAAMFVFITIPPVQHDVSSAAHPQMSVEQVDGSALMVRLIHVSPRHASTSDVSSGKPRSRKRPPEVVQPTRVREQAQVSDVARVSELHKAGRINSLDLSVPDGEEKQFVVGRDWGRGKAKRPNIRLPGGNAIPGVPHFEMVDPRSQGIAGVIHFIGSLTGAVDSHCLDLDAWQAMTVKERVAHGVSSDDVERIKDNYNCAFSHRRG